ncbi:aminomethyltransferase, mitochondrial isoform X1 [Hydra vulgaris]|uniref:Aminomethyltransferase n=1 Tax=Hydra vulgaris TaxID=6087 RepID=T2MG17_HYDVU|nr:aminomethyltransferase, mitochondrial [Hydra vulgaris]
MVNFRCGNTFLLQTKNCVFRNACLYSTKKEDLLQTKLYDFHIKNGGKMVPFAGWLMPVQYSDQGIIQSHLHTRKKASLFDVSHMLQFNIHGRDRVKFLEELVVADIKNMSENAGGLSLFMNAKGGIIDDCIINNAGDHIYVVSNAGCAYKIKPLIEMQFLHRKTELDIDIEFLNKSLLAIQGPTAKLALQEGVSKDLSRLKFMHGQTMNVFGVEGCRVTRCGYTGEDGFEVSIPSEKVENIADNLLGIKTADVKLAGLGARDTLRLEAGLCLYGNDISEETTPIEAGLMWTIGKQRMEARDFPGADIVLNQIKNKPEIKRVGLIAHGPPARGHTPVMDLHGNKIGEVTSGCPSPSLQQNIAMAYVPTALSKISTKLQLQRGSKYFQCEVVKLPFVPTKYFV